jgi:hypothetical protein
MEKSCEPNTRTVLPEELNELVPVPQLARWNSCCLLVVILSGVLMV